MKSVTAKQTALKKVPVSAHEHRTGLYGGRAFVLLAVW